MDKKSQVAFDEKVGVCIKNENGVVLEQNDECTKICGNRQGKICADGCMAHGSESPKAPRTDSFRSMKNIFPQGRSVDAVVINNNHQITTLLFDQTQSKEKKLELLNSFGLTPSEQAIVEMVVNGSTNREIAAKFGIAKSTLKSHLSHIYSKLPEELRKELRKERSVSTTKAGG